MLETILVKTLNKSEYIVSNFCYSKIIITINVRDKINEKFNKSKYIVSIFSQFFKL